MGVLEMHEGRKRMIVWLALACAAVTLFMLLSPWATVPVLESHNAQLEQEIEPGISSSLLKTKFTIFNLGRLADEVNKAQLNDIITNGIGKTAVAVAVLGGVVLLLLLVFAVLLIMHNSKSVLFGFLAFTASTLLPLFFMNAVFNANNDSAFSGPGLFTDFLTITPYVYIFLFFSVFCLVLVMPALVDVIAQPAEQLKGAGLTLSGKKLSFQSRFRNTLASVIRDRHLYLMLLPFLLYYIIFYFLPYRGLQMAFMDYKILLGYEGSKWIGFETFRKFFTGPYFWRVLRNTLTLNIYSLLFGFPIPILLAILFNELRSKHFRTVAQTISYIPNFISAVVIAGLVVNFLSPSAGIVNIVLGWFGVDPIYFISKAAYFRTIYVVQSIWTSAGFGSIIYYSSICSIDAELYEAATIDGAGRFRQVLHVTLPSIATTIAIMLILAIGGIMNSSTEMVLLLYRPATYDVSDIIGTYVYRLGMFNKNPNYSLATAVGLFNGVIAFVLVLSANKISKKISETSIF